jgi:hypothetical protein
MPATKRKVTRKATSHRKPTACRKMQTKRELIDTGTSKLFVRRNARGMSFARVVDPGRSLARIGRRFTTASRSRGVARYDGQAAQRADRDCVA